jgi:hypothetical protein
MTARLSSGLVDDFIENPGVVQAAYIGTGLTLADGGTGNDTITRGSGSWITDGYRLGDYISLFGCTTTANNFIGKKILALTATQMDIATGSVNTPETSIAGTVCAVARGGGLNDLLKFGYLKIFTGSQPSNADSVETGTLLVKITDNSGAHTTGLGTNGLQFNDDATLNKLSKLTTQTWKGNPGNSGTAGWFRFYSRDGVEGASAVAVRFDGACGLSGSELNLATTSIQSGVEFVINGFEITIPSA